MVHPKLVNFVRHGINLPLMWLTATRFRLLPKKFTPLLQNYINFIVSKVLKLFSFASLLRCSHRIKALNSFEYTQLNWHRLHASGYNGSIISRIISLPQPHFVQQANMSYRYTVDWLVGLSVGRNQTNQPTNDQVDKRTGGQTGRWTDVWSVPLCYTFCRSIGTLIAITIAFAVCPFGIWRLQDDSYGDCDFCAAGIKWSAHQSPLNCDNVIKMQTLPFSDAAAEGKNEVRFSV